MSDGFGKLRAGRGRALRSAALLIALPAVVASPVHAGQTTVPPIRRTLPPIVPPTPQATPTPQVTPTPQAPIAPLPTLTPAQAGPPPPPPPPDGVARGLRPPPAAPLP